MIILPDCYIGINCKNIDKLIKKLNKGTVLKNFFIVCFCNNASRLEIISSRMFLLKHFRNQNYEICAVVEDENTAFEYVKVLTDISYKEFNDFNPRFAVSNISLNKIKKGMLEEDN